MGGPALRFAGRRATELSETMFVERSQPDAGWEADRACGKAWAEVSRVDG